MTDLASGLGVGPLQGETGIPVVVEAIRHPLAGRSMASLAPGDAAFLELALVNIVMAGRTRLGGAPVGTGCNRRSSLSLPVERLVAGLTLRLGVSSGQGIPGTCEVIKWPYVECGCV